LKGDCPELAPPRLGTDAFFFNKTAAPTPAAARAATPATAATAPTVAPAMTPAPGPPPPPPITIAGGERDAVGEGDPEGIVEEGIAD